jgi:glc operon protein GlcG
MRNSLRTLCGIACAAVIGGASAADAPPRQSIDDAAAESMAQQCFGHSRANTWPPFTIAVVDAGGSLIFLRRQDGASPVTAEAAVLKARTASRSGAPTQALAGMSQDPPTRDLLLLLQLADDPGGVPLISAGRIIGALGVSGGTAEQDVGCANLAAGAWAGERK